LAIFKECKKQEWSRQYTPGSPFQRGQQEDQRHAGRMMLKRYTEVKSAELENPFLGEKMMEGAG
jgi:hypothetical protein